MAKNTRGVVRKIDNLGRLVIPIEIYRQSGFIGREEEVDIVPTEDGILIRRCEQNNIEADIRSVIDKYEHDGVNTDMVKELKKLVEAKNIKIHENRRNYDEKIYIRNYMKRL